MAIATIGRWGNTPAVRLPKDRALRAKISDGDQVELEEVDGERRLRKRAAVPSLDAMSGRLSMGRRPAA